MSASTVLLWRHGRTSYNQERRFQGQTDIPLDERGIAQARAAARLLAVRLAGLSAAAGQVRIVTSDLSRAAMTADALAERLGLTTVPEPMLREIAAGQWEGLLRPEIKSRWPQEFRAWRRGEDVRVGGQERRSEAAARAAVAIRRHAAELDGGVLVAVSHGGCLRAAMPLLLGLEPAATEDGVQPARFGVLQNAHWAELTVDDGPWKLVTYNQGVMEPPSAEPGDVADAADTVMHGPDPVLDGEGGPRGGQGCADAPGTDLEPAALATIDSVGRDDGIV